MSTNSSDYLMKQIFYKNEIACVFTPINHSPAPVTSVVTVEARHTVLTADLTSPTFSHAAAKSKRKSKDCFLSFKSLKHNLHYFTFEKYVP